MDGFIFHPELDRIETNGAQRRALMKQPGGESGCAEAFSRAINAALNRAEENAPAKRPPDLIGFDTAN